MRIEMSLSLAARMERKIGGEEAGQQWQNKNKQGEVPSAR
jgi:hypothetical protein